MILNKIRNKFWGSTNFKLHMQEMEDDLKDIWIEFSLKMLKELQKVRHGYSGKDLKVHTKEDLDNFWLTFCKEGAKMFGIKDCDDCEEKLKEII